MDDERWVWKEGGLETKEMFSHALAIKKKNWLYYVECFHVPTVARD